jgi:oxygen-independent coproporphyrinogen-3 oxidase
MTTTSKPADPFNRESDKYRADMTAPRKSLGLYIHVPFCVRKCNYCDFLSFGAVEKDVQTEYFRALIKEIRNKGMIYSNIYYVDSIFIGGGTPSLVSGNLVADMMEAVKESFLVGENAEISIESNPKTLEKDKLTVYLEAGINRLSIGAQSFDNDLLAYLGRIHTKEDLLKNYHLARECGFRNINIDLMFAIPGQTAGIWSDTMERALALEPEHISFYGLQIEEGTPFYSMFRNGSLKQTEDELDRQMYHSAVSLLRDRGYLHYEISNAAREGYPCRHNLKYWSMEDYLGLGLGAHSYMQGVRSSNMADLEKYIRAAEGLVGDAESSLTVWRHENTKEEDISEYLFTGMRKITGVELSDFRARFGVSLESLYEDVLEKYRQNGLVEIKNGFLRFTETGIDISNRVLAEFV